MSLYDQPGLIGSDETKLRERALELAIAATPGTGDDLSGATIVERSKRFLAFLKEKPANDAQ